MREMKDSGINWLGKMPSHWSIHRNKEIFRNVSVKNHGDATVLSLYRELGVVPKDSRDDNHNVTSLDTDSYKYVEPGDLVINKMKAWSGSLGVSKHEGIVSPAYYVCKVDYSKTTPRFIHHYLRNLGIVEAYEMYSAGMRIGQWDLGIDDFMGIEIALPPLEEQEQISNTIDACISKIDVLIANQQAQIEKLKQYKQSLITEVVTKGLDPNATMKDSGVEWIGPIPQKWKAAPLKTVFSFGKGLPITKENLVEKGIPVISYGQIHAKWNSGVTIHEELKRFVSEDYLASNSLSLVKRGDFIMADTSEDYEGCGNCAYVDIDELLFAGYHTIILKANSKTDNKYLAYLFRTDAWRSQIRKRVSGVKIFSISRKILGEMSIIVPDNANELVAFLDDKCFKIDRIIQVKQSKIEGLGKYKKSLIYEHATGKKEAE